MSEIENQVKQILIETPVVNEGSVGLPMVILKTCNRCHVEKDINLFTAHGTSKDGHHSICRECLVELGREAKIKDMGRIADERLARDTDADEAKWSKYMNQLYKDSIKPGAPAATRDLYAVLVGKKVERKEILLGLNADEIARRNLMARKALQEELRKEVE